MIQVEKSSQRSIGLSFDQTLWLYMLVVFFHWVEHLSQVYQVYVFGWLPKQAGGFLGFLFPQLARSEVLHFAYNLFLLGGLLLLLPGFSGRARYWWIAALVLQSWHFFEHALLQIEYLTGIYLFDAAEQIGIGQLWLPRVELHFAYNFIVFVPMMIGVYLHLTDRSRTTQTR